MTSHPGIHLPLEYQPHLKFRSYILKQIHSPPIHTMLLKPSIKLNRDMYQILFLYLLHSSQSYHTPLRTPHHSSTPHSTRHENKTPPRLPLPLPMPNYTTYPVHTTTYHITSPLSSLIPHPFLRTTPAPSPKHTPTLPSLPCPPTHQTKKSSHTLSPSQLQSQSQSHTPHNQHRHRHSFSANFHNLRRATGTYKP